MIDEEGKVIENFAKNLTITESIQNLSFNDVASINKEVLIVNERACPSEVAIEMIALLKHVNLLVDNVLSGDFMLKVNDEDITPKQLLQRYIDNETIDNVSINGQTIESVKDLLLFLKTYDLMTESGSKQSWNIKRGGNKRSTNVSELLMMLENPEVDKNQLITIGDSTPITLKDFEVMMNIEKEVKRIEKEYFNDKYNYTKEQLSSIESIANQMQREGGIFLEPNAGASQLVFPSGVDHHQRVSVAQHVTVKNGEAVEVTLSLAHAATSDITLNYDVIDGTVSGTINNTKSGTISFEKVESSKIIKIQSIASDERWNGKRHFTVQLSNLKNALFDNDVDFTTIVVSVQKEFVYTLNRENGLIKVPYNWNFSSTFQPERIGGYEFNYRFDNVGSEAINYRFSGIDTFFDVGNDFSCEEFLTDQDGQIPSNKVGFSAKPFTTENIKPIYVIDSPVTGSTIHLKYNYLGLIKTWVEDGILSHVSGTGEGLKSYTDYRGVKCENLSTFSLAYNDDDSDWYMFGSANRVVTLDDTILDNDTTFVAPLANKQFLDLKITSKRIVENRAQASQHVEFQTRIDTLNFVDMAVPTVASVTTPKTYSFYYGQLIPVMVEFSEPVFGKDITIDVNGKTLVCSEGSAEGFSKVQTFMYKVGANDTQLTVTNIKGAKDLSNFVMVNDSNEYKPVVKIKTPTLLTALNTPSSASVYSPVYNEKTGVTQVNVDVSIELPLEGRDFLLSSYSDASGLHSDKVAMSIDGGKTLVPLTFDDVQNASKLVATMDVPLDSLQNNFVVELFEINVNNNVVSKNGIVFGKYCSFSVNPPVPLLGRNIQISSVTSWPSKTINLNDAPTDLKLTSTILDTNVTWKQIEWKSSDDNVATIDSSGAISINKAGTVSFYAVAKNGGLTQYQGDDYKSNSTEALTIVEGSNPYIRFGLDKVSIVEGDDVVVRFASNLVSKNGEEKTTEFSIKVKNSKGELVEDKVLKFDPKNKGDLNTWPNQVHTFSGLSAVSQGDNASYTISVTSTYDGEEVAAKKDMKVFVRSKPAVVTLKKPTSYYITDETTTFDVGYELSHVDRVNSGTSFKMTVYNNETKQLIQNITDVPSADTGLVNIPLSVTNGFRNTYDVFVEVKNANDGSFSRDAYTLTVYDKDCLDIIVEASDRVKVDGDTAVLSNVERIKKMSQEEILNLKRDINLQAMVSIKAKGQQWNDIIDRMVWSTKTKNGVEDKSIVDMTEVGANQQIMVSSDVTYSPLSKFLLSGKKDGTTVLSVLHKLSNGALKAEEEIKVETLKDKLYLFQVFPATTTILTYKDKDGTLKTVTSNDKGQAAIFEENGICSDVLLDSTYDGNKYVGTLTQERLVSREQNPLSLELYPQNSFTLRKVASLPVYIKNSDGSNYTGEARIRSGVYRNGVYCQDALVNHQSNGKTDDYVVQFNNGKYQFNYDITQLDDGSGRPVDSTDNIKIVLEIAINNSLPILVEYEGKLNAVDSLVSGELIFERKSLSNNQTSNAMISQVLDNEVMTVDVLGTTKSSGPSSMFPTYDLKTLIVSMDTDKVSTITMMSNGKALLNQTTSASFTKFVWLEHSVPLNQAQLTHLNIGSLASSALTMKYVNASGTTIRQEDLPWRLLNALDNTQVNSEANIKKIGSSLLTSLTSTIGSPGFGNSLISGGLTAVSALSIDNPLLHLKLIPTSDPLVFKGLVYIGYDSIQNDNVTGFQSDVTRESDLDPGPGFSDMKAFAKGGFKGYAKKASKEWSQGVKDLNKALTSGSKGVSNTGHSVTLSGAMETRIYYDEATSSWKHVILTGKASAGYGMSYTYTMNMMAGPIPFFVSLGAGASGVVTFNVAVNNKLKVNDYLINIRINAYVQAFGGLGFDYSVFAMKIGVFGQVSADFQFDILKAANQNPHVGYILKVRGDVGVKFQAKLLFISYEKILVSKSVDFANVKSTHYDLIMQYWNSVKDGTYVRNGEVQSLLSAKDIDSDIYYVDVPTSIMDKSYVSEQEWHPNDGFFAFLQPKDKSKKILQASYPEANPVLSDDGMMMFYLDDQGKANITSLRVAVSNRDNNTYAQGTILSDDGYGDFYVSASGVGDKAVVAFSRLKEKPLVTEPGEQVNENIQTMMMNSSELMVASKKDGQWHVEQLTENTTSDTSPVIATNGSERVVVWRNDSNVLMIKEYRNEQWQDAYVLYDGLKGVIKGLNVTMASNGNALVGYVIDEGNGVKHDGNGLLTSQQEIYSALVNSGIQRFTRLTNDSDLDECPQIRTVTMNNEEVFVMGWYSLQTLQGSQVHDIRLAAFDTEGNRKLGFVDHCSEMLNDKTVISNNFRFVKNGKNITDLSIIWSQLAISEKTKEMEASSHEIAAVRFTYDNDKIGLTSAQKIMDMDLNTTVNQFDGFVVDSDKSIEMVVLGTFYDNTSTEVVAVSDNEKVTNVNLPKQTTSIYQGSGYFIDAIEVESIVPDFPNVKSGVENAVSVTLSNQGTCDINKVDVTIGDQKTEINQVLKPGEKKTLVAYYVIPTKISNTTAKVEATFVNSSKAKYEQNLLFEYYDLGVSSKESVVKQENGKRTLHFTLYNLSDSKLKDFTGTVKVGLYYDNDCTDPFKEETIHKNDYALLDDGRYTAVFDVNMMELMNKEFSDGDKKVKPYINEDGEIVKEGIPMYVKCWLEVKENNEMVEMIELSHDNNRKAIILESLLQDSTTPVLLTTSRRNEENKMIIDVSVLNCSIKNNASGNLSVLLKDSEGRIVGYQETLMKTNGLLTLQPEERKESEFIFENVKSDVTVEVVFANKETEDNNVELNALNIEDKTKEDIVDDQLTVNVVDEKTTSLVVSAASATTKVKVKYDSQETEVNSSGIVTLNLTDEKVCEVILTAENGNTRTIVLTINQIKNDITINKIDDIRVVYGNKDVVVTPVAKVKENPNALITYEWFEKVGENFKSISKEKELVLSSKRVSGTTLYKCVATTINSKQKVFTVESNEFSFTVAKSLSTFKQGVEVVINDGTYIVVKGSISDYDKLLQDTINDETKTMQLYVDGILLQEKVSGINVDTDFIFETTYFGAGKHTITLKYVGNDYFMASEASTYYVKNADETVAVEEKKPTYPMKKKLVTTTIKEEVVTVVQPTATPTPVVTPTIKPVEPSVEQPKEEKTEGNSGLVVVVVGGTVAATAIYLFFAKRRKH